MWSLFGICLTFKLEQHVLLIRIRSHVWERLGMLRTTCLNVMETECQPTVCKSAHQSTVICLAVSSFPASGFYFAKDYKIPDPPNPGKAIQLIPCTPGWGVILHVSNESLSVIKSGGLAQLMSLILGTLILLFNLEKRRSVPRCTEKVDQLCFLFCILKRICCFAFNMRWREIHTANCS